VKKMKTFGVFWGFKDIHKFLKPETKKVFK